jgi:4'-phosphopantetheinyl transferase
VLSLPLDVTADRRAALERLLSSDERERADRYLVPERRERFVVARGSLRETLGRLTGVPPQELRFSYPCLCGRPGCPPSARKPRLELEAGRPRLRFNLAHADGLVMLAVAVDREVGIDVERIDRAAAAGPVVEWAFSSDEVAALRRLPVQEQAEAFARGWTRKEAYAKARGDGLELPGPDTGAADGWSFFDVAAPPGYVASLAVEGQGCAVVMS